MKHIDCPRCGEPAVKDEDTGRCECSVCQEFWWDDAKPSLFRDCSFDPEPEEVTKDYAWGSLRLWVRKPGRCISTGYMAIHAIHGSDRDEGCIFYRAVDAGGTVIIGAFAEGTDVRKALLEASAFARTLADGKPRWEAAGRGRSARAGSPAQPRAEAAPEGPA